MAKYKISTETDQGGREYNEDSLGVAESELGTLAVVADGLGGMGDGEIASRLVVDTMKQEFENGNLDLEDMVQLANKVVYTEAQDKNSKMCTTVAAVIIEDEKTVIAHVGDSRVYAFLNNKIVFQSLDHSVSQMAVKVGEITADEIRGHVDRNRLVRVIGAKEDVKVELAELNNEDYDALLICTDGFWEYVFEKEMMTGLKLSWDTDLWIKLMRRKYRIRAPKDRDNNTLIAIRRRRQ